MRFGVDDFRVGESTDVVAERLFELFAKKKHISCNRLFKFSFSHINHILSHR